MDHHCWIIITGSRSSLDLDQYHGCYLMILLVTRSSTKPGRFHVGCRPRLHIGLLQRLYPTLSQNGPPNTYIWSCRNQNYNHIRKACPTLTSDHVGTHPTTLSERPSTHIWPCEEQIQHTCQKGSALTFNHARNQSNIHVQKGYALTSAHARNQSSMHVRRDLHLHLHMWGTNPVCMSKGL